MKSIPNRTWKLSDKKQVSRVKSWLLEHGGREDLHLTSMYEDWRVRLSDATVTYYKKGTLFVTSSADDTLRSFHAFVESFTGARFRPPSRDWVVGFDEAGKGEVLGPAVLAGVAIPKSVFERIENDTGSADTKKKHSFDYWENLDRKIKAYRQEGVRFLTEKIFPREIDKYNMNKFLDVVYQRMVALLIEGLGAGDVRIVIDDYGTGTHLNQYLARLKKNGTEVIITTKADDVYLEGKIASLTAKSEQQAILKAISEEPSYQLPGISLGSGNAGDPSTLEWLHAWKDSGRRWPWFVRTSFKTIRQMDGFALTLQKPAPAIQEKMVAQEFLSQFSEGHLHTEAFAIFCPGCHHFSKAIRLTLKDGQTTVVCAQCSESMDAEKVHMILRAYCDRLLPDDNAAAGDFFSQDLEGTRFFEGFTVLLHPGVKQMNEDRKGGGLPGWMDRFSAMGLIRVESLEGPWKAEAESQRNLDKVLAREAVKANAVLVTKRGLMTEDFRAHKVFHIELEM